MINKTKKTNTQRFRERFMESRWLKGIPNKIGRYKIGKNGLKQTWM